MLQYHLGADTFFSPEEYTQILNDEEKQYFLQGPHIMIVLTNNNNIFLFGEGGMEFIVWYESGGHEGRIIDPKWSVP